MPLLDSPANLLILLCPVLGVHSVYCIPPYSNKMVVIKRMVKYRNKTLVITVDLSNKMLVRIANKKDADQMSSSDTV